MTNENLTYGDETPFCNECQRREHCFQLCEASFNTRQHNPLVFQECKYCDNFLRISEMGIEKDGVEREGRTLAQDVDVLRACCKDNNEDFEQRLMRIEDSLSGRLTPCKEEIRSIVPGDLKNPSKITVTKGCSDCPLANWTSMRCQVGGIEVRLSDNAIPAKCPILARWVIICIKKEQMV
jgi:hypothetical protein